MEYSRDFIRALSDKSSYVLDVISGELTFRRDVVRKTAVENAIAMYQETGDDLDFAIVRSIYDPGGYSWKWRERYLHLFDSTEDFDSIFEECFVKACRGYADEEARHRLGIEVMGNGSFNNYFYGVLTKTFANIMKSKACGSRNPDIRCPICDAIVAPLNLHILRDHDEYSNEIVAAIVGKQSDKQWTCSLCPPYARKVKFVEGEELRRHIVSKHSSAVFERFSRDYPNHSMAMREPAAAGGLIGNEESMSTHDALEQTVVSNLVGSPTPRSDEEYGLIDLGHDIISAGLSPCQMAMVDFVLDASRASSLPTRNKLCEACLYRSCGECQHGGSLTKEQYVEEVDDLKDKMRGVLSGAEI